MCNEGELLEKFNIQLSPIPMPELTEEIKRVKYQDMDEVTQIINYCRENMEICVKDNELENIAALKAAMKNLAQKYGCQDIDIQCLNQLQSEIGIMPCAANQYKLDNLCAVVDRNRLQISGNTEDIMGHDILQEHFGSFGWNVITVNGNDYKELKSAFEEAKTGKNNPTVIIAETIKGYGAEIMENKESWHHKVPTAEEYEQIIKELDERNEAPLNE